jgi:hypothetical protein
VASVVSGGTTVKLDRLNIRRVAALTSLSLVGGFARESTFRRLIFSGCRADAARSTSRCGH